MTWLVACCLAAAVFPLLGTPLPAIIALALACGGIAWLIDVLTVRLVVAGRWRGLLGYEI
jgi:hypothetical protein